jgi:hypothetical protein
MNLFVAAAILISIYLIFDRLLGVSFPPFDTMLFVRS